MTTKIDGRALLAYLEANNISQLFLPKQSPPPEPAAPAEHPSVAWWAACPVITDRPPEECDGDALGHGHVLEWTGNDVTGFRVEHWEVVALRGVSWIHTASWRPPAPKSLQDQALAAATRFYAKGHEGCTDEEVKDDFDAICRALKRLEELEVAND